MDNIYLYIKFAGPSAHGVLDLEPRFFVSSLLIDLSITRPREPRLGEPGASIDVGRRGVVATFGPPGRHRANIHRLFGAFFADRKTTQKTTSTEPSQIAKVGPKSAQGSPFGSILGAIWALLCSIFVTFSKTSCFC